ncbi:hypothetical protein Golob_024508, partial [Gossypium lobatum]|nr:hypothetical protein [Gossypium lobatum]
MYITASSSPSSSLLRAASAYSPTRFFRSSFRNLTSTNQASLSVINHHRRSLTSAAVRSFHCSVPRWSHRLNWRSPLNLRSEIRAFNPIIEQLQRKFATMAAEHPFKAVLTSLPRPGGGEFGKFYSLPALNDPRIDKLPYSIRILLESAIRNCDNFQVKKEDVEKIIDWENTAPKQVEIPFKPARVLLQ